MPENIFGPGHYVDTKETTSRPTPIATGKGVDTWFKQCSPGLQDGSNVDDHWANFIVDTFRQSVRTAGATQGELIPTMLAEAMARYASGGIFCADGGTPGACVLASSLGFIMPKTYFHGMRLRWYPAAANAGPTTVTAYSGGVSLGPKALLRPDGAACVGGELGAPEVEATYDSAAAGGAGGFRLAPWCDLYDALLCVPQGYLSANANINSPINTADVAGASTFYWNPLVGDLCPINNGRRFVRARLGQLTLVLNNPNHVANTIYDFGVALVAGVPTIMTGPAWVNSGAGTGSRGTGAGTPEWNWVLGQRVNAVTMAGRNGTNTYSIPPNMFTLLGSLWIDGTAGQLSCHLSYGQSRKWGISHLHNKQPIILKAGDPNASWAYNVSAIRPSRNDANNCLSVFSALADERYDLVFTQKSDLSVAAGGTARADNGIGWNSTAAFSGKRGSVAFSNVTGGGQGGSGGDLKAEFEQAPSLGRNLVTALETVPAPGVANTYQGGEANMILSAKFRA